MIMVLLIYCTILAPLFIIQSLFDEIQFLNESNGLGRIKNDSSDKNRKYEFF